MLEGGLIELGILWRLCTPMRKLLDLQIAGKWGMDLRAMDDRAASIHQSACQFSGSSSGGRK